MKSNPMKFRALLVSASVLALMATHAPAQTDCDDTLVPQPVDCARPNADITVEMPAQRNTERTEAVPSGFGNSGFSISIEGERIAGSKPPSVPQRAQDQALYRADVDVRYDGLDIVRALNVSTTDLRGAYRAGETIRLHASANYPRFIKRAEIRIHDRKDRSGKTLQVLPVAANGTVAWRMPADGSGQYEYTLRVYDNRGRWDETQPLQLNRTAKAFDTHEKTGALIAAGEGDDRTRIRNIPLRGGMITASGTGARPGSTVTVMGEQVPVDASGSFVTTRVLPAGDHVVKVKVGGKTLVRDVEIPKHDWTYVGIIDLTYGRHLHNDLSGADPDYKSHYLDGRIAGFATGRTQAGYKITASVDTGEGDLEDIFRRLNDKDPRAVISRLDPDDLYPTYGDDSTSYDAAPTSGRVYLRVEKGGTRFTWGDFKADLDTNGYLSHSRALYGAELRYVSPDVTENGDPVITGSIYAAHPDTLASRDILRGSGGSVYFLTRQDVVGGSVSLTVETVDPVTGRVIERRRLVEGSDYRIDHVQGVIILTNPLPSSASGNSIAVGTPGQYDVNLVAQYEYTPTTGNIDGMSIGGRIEVKPSDRLTLGFGGLKDTTGVTDQTLMAADMRYELGEVSYIEAEIAQSEGLGFGRNISTNGGLDIDTLAGVNVPRARAYRLETWLDLEELGGNRPGHVNLYFERKDAGFSTLAQDITDDQTLFGVDAKIDVNDRLSFGLLAESFKKDNGEHKRTAELQLAYKLREDITLTGAVGHIDQASLSSATDTGRRTDVSLRLDYDYSDDLSVYGYAKGTVNRSGGIRRDNRLGLGFDTRLSEKVTLAGEVSDGTAGVGAIARLSYAPTADDEIYIGYDLDPERRAFGRSLVGRDGGTLVFGRKAKESDKVSTYAEQTIDAFGERRSLTRAYGVNYTPTAAWSLSGGIETGKVRDSINGDFDRKAFSFGVRYLQEDAVSASFRLEYRDEDGIGLARDRNTWAASAAYKYRLDENWRLLANADALISDNAATDFRDGEYVEASLGFAYRPVLNERLNLLARLSYLRDLPGPDQVTVNGTAAGPKQVSYVFSIDGNYDLNEKWTLGAKYGYRKSKVAPRGTNTFTNSTAHLGIVRLDYHLTHKWDIMGEYRTLFTKESGNRDNGALLGVYRHVGNNVKLGAGYEWGKVSDDITNLDYRNDGVFVNFVAKF